MRQALVETLIKKDSSKAYFLTGDLGYNVLEPLKNKMKGRFINVGIAEQSMIGIASGLALSGKEVYTYTITPFYLRAFEQIRLDLCYQDVPVTMIGTGSDFDYSYLGTSHFAFDVKKCFEGLLNLDMYIPKNIKGLNKLLSKKAKRPRLIIVGGYTENNDFEIDYNKLTKYPHEGGSRDYFKLKYQKDENTKQ